MKKTKLILAGILCSVFLISSMASGQNTVIDAMEENNRRRQEITKTLQEISDFGTDFESCKKTLEKLVKSTKAQYFEG